MEDNVCSRHALIWRERWTNWDPKFNLSLHNQILFDSVSHHFLEWHCVRLCGAEYPVMSLTRFRSYSGHRVYKHTEKPGYSYLSIHDKYSINTSISVSDYGIIFAHDRHCLQHKSQQFWNLRKMRPLLHVQMPVLCCTDKKEQTPFLFQLPLFIVGWRSTVSIQTVLLLRNIYLNIPNKL